MLHIILNLMAGFIKFTVRQKMLEWRIHSSTSVHEFESQLSILKMECGDDVRQYMRAIDLVHWVVFANLQHTPLYGWRTLNFVEAENGATLVDGTRDLEPYSYMKAMATSMIEDAYRRSTFADKWIVEGRIVTPNAEKKYDAENKRWGRTASRPRRLTPCTSEERTQFRK